MRASSPMDFQLRQLLTSSIGFASPLLAIGTAPAGFNTTNAIGYMIEGTKPVPVAALVSQLPVAEPTLQPYFSNSQAFYTQPANTTVYYLLVVNAAGALRVIQGTFAGQLFFGSWGALKGTGDVPNLDSLLWATYGLIKVVTGAATTYTPGVTAYNAALVTTTFINCAVAPATNP